MPAKTPSPVTLTGRHVRLEPLTMDHLSGLFAAGGGDDEAWRWQGGPTPHTQDELGLKLAELLKAAEQGTYIPFAVIALGTGQAVGWSTYMDIDAENERLEIGWTWYGRAFWRSAVNTEAKLLLLTHAFEELGMGRVQLKTDHMNLRSQAAIARLGAEREGVLRRHRRRPDGTWRDTVYFSLLAEEWPAAKARLSARI
ncbi:GNAT family N-acetyltransferase [Streptomyces lunaelactis]|uniref:GNAT family N-acetyltransferase n=1 Tax=Streptomyces lunaelactis TaxID=1535768 RepID=UPI0015845E18|nr:GNAT family protein [Streptomyces lunaelactis]NUK04048.1 GNAT family N-acetyltransferase [Streptomyces lunaelactis]NUK19356.1 GNAT family N-acetyltransferase [Streptomyces lunaelactis]NUK34749.1 GNAT family N-acetyltransferase [Streptomyces lunaelactis]NUK45053.1 GNAT family N-acetyltransferase [Streptomyces lunaelactis]NUK95589.1 GNAT family N-acetyltransferase [Streptomyces lunaelactis]